MAEPATHLDDQHHFDPGPEMLPPEHFGLGELFRRLRDAVVVAHTQTQRIILWNPAAEQIFGYTPEEAITLRVDEAIIPREYREQHRRAFARYAATGEAPIMHQGRTLELPATTKENTYLTIELSLSEIGQIQPEGYYPYVMAIIRDVTERKRLETLARGLYGAYTTGASGRLDHVHPATQPPNPSVEPLAPPTAHTLTPRELEVLAHLARGHSNPRIARELHLSVPTIKHHVRNITSKLGCTGRAEAAITAVKLGLLDTN